MQPYYCTVGTVLPYRYRASGRVFCSILTKKSILQNKTSFSTTSTRDYTLHCAGLFFLRSDHSATKKIKSQLWLLRSLYHPHLAKYLHLPHSHSLHHLQHPINSAESLSLYPTPHVSYPHGAFATTPVSTLTLQRRCLQTSCLSSVERCARLQTMTKRRRRGDRERSGRRARHRCWLTNAIRSIVCLTSPPLSLFVLIIDLCVVGCW